MIGKVISCLGGIYTVESEGEHFKCVAKGTFRHDGRTVVAGDTVEFERDGAIKGRENIGLIKSVHPRKNSLIRPEVANIDTAFVVFAYTSPEPNFLAIDKLLAILTHAKIKTVIVFNKKDIADSEKAKELYGIYSGAGFDVVELSAKNDGEEVRRKLLPYAKGISVFTGPSGVGKSTMINALFPELRLETGDVSVKTGRGKNTTRSTVLYKTGEESYYVDTPGFTLLDFDRFHFMDKEDLVYAFPEFSALVGECRYTKCTHTKEEGCAILEAIREGKISPTRHESYLNLWEILKKYKNY